MWETLSGLQNKWTIDPRVLAPLEPWAEISERLRRYKRSDTALTNGQVRRYKRSDTALTNGQVRRYKRSDTALTNEVRLRVTHQN